jgi:hypothetical protein
LDTFLRPAFSLRRCGYCLEIEADMGLDDGSSDRDSHPARQRGSSGVLAEFLSSITWPIVGLVIALTFRAPLAETLRSASGALIGAARSDWSGEGGQKR